MPFIVFAFTKNRLIGYLIPIMIVIANLAVTTGLAFYYEADPNPFMGTYFLNMYLKPWVWCGAYFVGVIFGFLYWEYKNEETKFYQTVKSSSKVAHMLLSIGVALTIVLIFSPIKAL